MTAHIRNQADPHTHPQGQNRCEKSEWQNGYAKTDLRAYFLMRQAPKTKEIAALKKYIISYFKARSVYEEYRGTGYSKTFLEAHRNEIIIHKSAKTAFDLFNEAK